MELTNIFLSEHLKLTEIDPKLDGETESGWMLDLDYARQRSSNPVRPKAAKEVQNDLEEKLKESNEGRRSFYYAIRAKQEDGELVGFLYLDSIEWKNGQGFLRLLFKDEDTTAQYMTESLQLALRYAFDELNLYHVCMELSDYALAAIRVVEDAGFMLEVCLREIIYREGQHHDRLIYGLLAQEWRKAKEMQA